MRSVFSIMVFAVLFALTSTASAVINSVESSEEEVVEINVEAGEVIEKKANDLMKVSMKDTAEGTIEAIDQGMMAISTETEESQQIIELEVNEKTNFSEPSVAMGGLQKGDAVKVAYNTQDDKKVAIFIAKLDRIFEEEIK